MKREEFDANLSEVLKRGEVAPEPTEEEYRIIEYVYKYHPSIKVIGGKKQIAYLYVHFGMGLIRDMLTRAEMMANLTKRKDELLKELENTSKLLKRIRDGGEI